MKTNEFNGLVESNTGMGSSFNSFQLSKEEEKQFEREIKYFESKAEKYGFKTSWCIYEIRALSLKSPFKGKWMSDGVHDVRVELPNRKLTGLQLWDHADKLYNLIGDINHMFIESFEQKGDTIEVSFGS